MVYVGKVVECSQVDAVNAHRGEEDADTWEYPVDPGILREAEDDEADGEEEGVEARKVETDLRVVVFLILHLLVTILLGRSGRSIRCSYRVGCGSLALGHRSRRGNVGALVTTCEATEEVSEAGGVWVLVYSQHCGERRTDTHGDEDEADLLGVEVVGYLEDEGDGGERHVEDCPREGDPEGEEEYYGLGEQEVLK